MFALVELGALQVADCDRYVELAERGEELVAQGWADRGYGLGNVLTTEGR